jgi:hypothetical protein
MQRRSCHVLAARPIASFSPAGEEKSFRCRILGFTEGEAVGRSLDEAPIQTRDRMRSMNINVHEARSSRHSAAG